MNPENLFLKKLSIGKPYETKKNQGLSRAWIRCPSGRRVDLLEPSPLDIEISDIALSLSRISRWAGMTATPYGFSVAQHSVLVVKIMEWMMASSPSYRTMIKKSGYTKKHWLLVGLLHDAAEAYLGGDLCGPAKANMKDDTYRNMEDALQKAVYIKMGLPAEIPEEIYKAVKIADRASAYAEAVLIVGFTPEEAEPLFGIKTPLKNQAFLDTMSTEEAYKAFLALYKRLKVI